MPSLPLFDNNYKAVNEAMEAGFKPGRFYELFKKYIQICVDNWRNAKIYAPIATIIQSSGNGKTRFVNKNKI